MAFTTLLGTSKNPLKTALRPASSVFGPWRKVEQCQTGPASSPAPPVLLVEGLKRGQRVQEGRWAGGERCARVGAPGTALPDEAKGGAAGAVGGSPDGVR